MLRLTLMTTRRDGTGWRRLLFAVAALGLAASGCISSDPPPADADPVVLPAVPTAGATELEVDEATLELVEDYWDAREAAWASGVEAGLAFTVANNHPLLSYTADECRQAFFDGEAPVGFVERNELDASSVVRDPDFALTVGPLAGRELGEGLLEMKVAFSYEGQDLLVADRVASVHLQAVDDQIRHFLVCEPVEIQVVEAPQDTSGGDTTDGDGTTVDVDASTGDDGTSVDVDVMTGDPVTVLPPITATPVPGTGSGSGSGSGSGDGGSGGGGGGGGGGGTGSGSSGGGGTGSRPPGAGVDFCINGNAGDQPAAGDYYLCSDDDVDPTSTASPSPSATASEDVTRG